MRTTCTSASPFSLLGEVATNSMMANWPFRYFVERFFDNCPLPKKQHLLEAERAIEPVAQRWGGNEVRMIFIKIVGLLSRSKMLYNLLCIRI